MTYFSEEHPLGHVIDSSGASATRDERTYGTSERQNKGKDVFVVNAINIANVDTLCWVLLARNSIVRRIRLKYYIAVYAFRACVHCARWKYGILLDNACPRVAHRESGISPASCTLRLEACLLLSKDVLLRKWRQRKQIRKARTTHLCQLHQYHGIGSY